MYCEQLISGEIPVLGPNDSVGHALHQMEEWKLRHLPVTQNGQYLGMLSEDDLLDLSEDTELAPIRDRFRNISVQAQDIFLKAVRRSREMNSDLVAVLSEQDVYEGVITQEGMLRELSRFTGVSETGSLVVLEMDRHTYAPGEINRLVESNDAFITQLNTWYDASTQQLTVILRINREEVSDIVATFQRYEYTVRYYMGEELYRNELQSNLEHLLNYLNI
jgi:acetoin utilization protein AcuB